MAAQAGLCLAWSQTPKDTFCRVVAHLYPDTICSSQFFWVHINNWASAWDYGTFRPLQIHSSNPHVQPSSGARCLIFGQTLRLLPYFVCVNSEGSGKTVQMRRLAWAFAGRLCDKYHNLVSWLNYYHDTGTAGSKLDQRENGDFQRICNNDNLKMAIKTSFFEFAYRLPYGYTTEIIWPTYIRII